MQRRLQPTEPWRLDQAPRNRFLYAVLCFALFIATLVVVVGVLFGIAVLLFSAIDYGDFQLDNIPFVLLLIALGFIASYLLVKTLRWTYYRYAAYSMEPTDPDLPLTYLSDGLLRTMAGSGDYQIVGEEFRLTGTVVFTNEAFQAILATMGVAALTVALGSVLWGFAIGIALAVLIAIVFRRWARRIQRREAVIDYVPVTHESLKSVKCFGPIVILKLDPPPWFALRQITFCVHQDYAQEFFADFEQHFPGRLPACYRSAIG